MTRLFLLNDARPQHPDVQRWLAEHTDALGTIAAHWFAILRAAGPDVGEVLHDGQPTVCVQGAAFAYIGLYQAHVNVGFFDGALLPDPHGVLRGTGRFMRHVTIPSNGHVDRMALTALIGEAYMAVSARLAQSAPGASP